MIVQRANGLGRLAWSAKWPLFKTRQAEMGRKRQFDSPPATAAIRLLRTLDRVVSPTARPSGPVLQQPSR